MHEFKDVIAICPDLTGNMHYLVSFKTMKKWHRNGTFQEVYLRPQWVLNHIIDVLGSNQCIEGSRSYHRILKRVLVFHQKFHFSSFN